MPFCTVKARHGVDSSAAEERVKLFYRTYGDGDCKVMMIMGVAATNLAWWPQIKALAGTNNPNEPDDLSDEVEAEREAEAALRPEVGDSAGNREKAKTKATLRIKSDLGHRLMVHGAQALADSNESETSASTTNSGTSGLEPTSSESSGDVTSHPTIFERLDSDSLQPERDGQWGAKGERHLSMAGTTKLTGREICVFDNRGVGKSSHPADPKCYRTDIMARDALAIADQLGWKRFHVIGHSMGGMISCKLAAIAPSRVLSLAVISASNGGFDCLPRLEVRPLRVLTRLVSAKTPEQRAAVDLDTHFSENFLSEMVDGLPRRQRLHKEYVQTLSTKGAMQPKHAQSGQLSACWNHSMTSEDIRSICQADIPTSVIHGSDDVIAHVSLGRRMAKRLRPVARFVELYGGHMIIRERIDEVNAALIELLDAAHEGAQGAAWVETDPHREESDSMLVHWVCGQCFACTEVNPQWANAIP